MLKNIIKVGKNGTNKIPSYTFFNSISFYFIGTRRLKKKRTFIRGLEIKRKIQFRYSPFKISADADLRFFPPRCPNKQVEQGARVLPPYKEFFNNSLHFERVRGLVEKKEAWSCQPLHRLSKLNPETTGWRPRLLFFSPVGAGWAKFLISGFSLGRYGRQIKSYIKVVSGWASK